MSFKKSCALLLALLTVFSVILTGCKSVEYTPSGRDSDISTLEVTDTDKSTDKKTETQKETEAESGFSIENIKPYSGKAYIVVNNNQPEFKTTELKKKAYEFYSELDSLGRCGYAMASVCIDTMPPEGSERKSVSFKPTGWINNSYDTSIVPGGYLYNRCHLIGWQLTDENSNKKNLITGTRYMNMDGMYLFEDMIADYVKETNNHVMYRVTPIFEGNNLVASGVHMEGYSIEDKGDGICFNVFAYNVQPGIIIDYATGENKLDPSYIPPQEDPEPEEDEEEAVTPMPNPDPDPEPDPDPDPDPDPTPTPEPDPDPDPDPDPTPTPEPEPDPDPTPTPEPEPEPDPEYKYILNTNSKKIHYHNCSSISTMAEKNKQGYNGSVSDMLAQGYTACKTCKPE